MTKSSKTKVGDLYLPSKQAESAIPAGMEHHTFIIPAQNVPVFSGYHTVDIKEKNCLLHNVTLQYNVNPLVCDASSNCLNPPTLITSQNWLQRVEVICGGNIIQTLWGEQIFLTNNLFNNDFQRLKINNASGSYASYQQRYNKSSTTSDYFVHLPTFLDTIHLPLLHQNSEIQLRVFLRPFAEIIDLQGGTLNSPAPQSSINFCNVVADITRMPNSLSGAIQYDLTKNNFDYIYNDVRYFTQNLTINAGSTNSVVLTAIQGRVSWLMFILRPTSNIYNEKSLQFSQIKNFEILNSSSQNIVGGQPITNDLDKKLMEKWTTSTYCEETAIGSNLGGYVEDNKANVYIWSFSSSPVDSVKYGSVVGSHHFKAQEQLRFQVDNNFPSGNYQIDVFGFVESVFKLSSNGTAKLQL